ncbi:hypothetical protein RDWZM_008134 [Blomia tropicalis]|uniref:Rab effector Noc2 n=1 Tax=Blomia tropicalis TaxID=40697 RepID=A0A9Q0M3T8_BLOTA|nr:Doc2bp [Blomia tropicalis]KAJ6216977.1 hypothetical protein RDWZM_008134 [Blomia tropicalis]
MNSEGSSWVCPNDRELMLRAKLETGWSCKSTQFQSLQWKQEKISESEKKMILEVLSKAQKTEEIEQKRIGKLMERLKNMKRSARGNGNQSCILCNESFGLFAFQAHQCHGCRKLVCTKCGVDTINKKNGTIWFCKICSETREVLKKSGCWFNNLSIELTNDIESSPHQCHEKSSADSISMISSKGE